MSNVLVRSITTVYGKLEYHKTICESHQGNILFIHGLGEDKSWFPDQFKRYSLQNFGNWLVPDLLGHGKSAKPKHSVAYTMNQQASYLFQLLSRELNEDKRLIIIAHSLGGPIAVSLCELISKSPLKNYLIILIYLEGNLDKNDTFFSSKIISQPLNTFEEKFEQFIARFKDIEIPPNCYRKLKTSGAFSLWWTSKNLVSVSESEQLISRIQQLKIFKKYFVYGENNEGKFTSEYLVKLQNLPLIYIPNTGHFMHLENPDSFWLTMKGLLLRILN